MRNRSEGRKMKRSVTGWMLPVLLFLLLFAGSCRAADSDSYIVETDEENSEQILYFLDGEERHEIDRNAHVTILREADFNGDGVPDVLVVTDTGGSCCPPEYAIHSWVNGAVMTVAIDCNGEPEVIERGNGLAIRSQTIEKTTISVLRGSRLEVVKTIPQLKAIKELHSLGRGYEGKKDHQILKVDVDDDGVVEEIRCEHWEFQGSMICSLPRPHDEEQNLHLSCDRFGMLAAKSNGYHQFVCDNDTLFVFDGYRWTVSNPETEQLAEQIQKLVPVIGNYPPKFHDDKEKEAVRKSYEEIRGGLDAQLNKETFDNGLHPLYLRGFLQTMGHNFDFPQAWDGATQDLQAVLAKEPGHVPSLLALGRMWVNSHPEMAPQAEKLFLAAQCFHGREPLEEAQQGLFFALYYQGRMVEALRQANYLATTWPKETQYQKMADMTRDVLKRTNASVEPPEPLTAPLGLEDCKK